MLRVRIKQMGPFYKEHYGTDIGYLVNVVGYSGHNQDPPVAWIALLGCKSLISHNIYDLEVMWHSDGTPV